MSRANVRELDDVRERFATWLADNDTVICVYENHDLGSREVGARFALPYSREAAARLVVGSSRAPDTRMGLGWRYILTARCDDVPSAMRALLNEPQRRAL